MTTPFERTIDLLALFRLVTFGAGFGRNRLEVLLDRHHPAAGELAVLAQVHGALFLEHLEGASPELEAQDVAFPRQQVVVHVHPRHRLQVGANDTIGDERGHRGVLVAAVLDVVQRVGTQLQPLAIALIPLGGPGIEIPAVVIESSRVGDGRDLARSMPSSTRNPTTTSATCTPVSSM